MLPNTILNNLVMQRGKKLPQNSAERKHFILMTLGYVFSSKMTRSTTVIGLMAHPAKSLLLTETVGNTIKISMVDPCY